MKILTIALIMMIGLTIGCLLAQLMCQYEHESSNAEITAFSNDLLYKIIEQSWVEIGRRNGESRCPKCYTYYEGSNMKGDLCSLHEEPNEPNIIVYNYADYAQGLIDSDELTDSEYAEAYYCDDCAEWIKIRTTIHSYNKALHIEYEHFKGGVEVSAAEPNEPDDEVGEISFTLIDSPGIISVEFSAVDRRIVCDSTKEEFLETLPHYLYWMLYNVESKDVPVIEWAEPNDFDDYVKSQMQVYLNSKIEGKQE